MNQNLTPEQKSAVRDAIAAQQAEQLTASTARQDLEEKIAARAYQLFTETPRKERLSFADYRIRAERELTEPTEPAAEAPKPRKKETQPAAE